jgi:hypothetical protein
LDHGRLAQQRVAVWNFMESGGWHTLAEISAATGAPEASVSARLRDLRKLRFGQHLVEREYVEGSRGLYQYRLIPRVAEVAR